MFGSKITALTYALPCGRLTHETLCERFGRSVMDKIASNTGIWERRVSPDGVCTSDLAYDAANLLFSKFGIAKNDIDLIVFATQTPDYLLPSNACIMQDRLKLPKSAAAFDINLGCTQYTYSLCVINGLICGGAFKKALLLSGDTPSKMLNPMDKGSVALFGDVAAATILERSSSAWFIDAVYGTDGSGAGSLILPGSGFRHGGTNIINSPICAGTSEEDCAGSKDLFMDGLKIFTFAFKRLPESVFELLARNSLSVSDIDLFIFHQAGEKIIKAAAERLAIPMERLHLNLRNIGNTGGSSVAAALADAYMQGKLKTGMKVVLASFGVGLSWNALLLEWKDGFLGADMFDGAKD